MLLEARGHGIWQPSKLPSAIEAGVTETRDKARHLAVSAPHSGDWLKALPISACGLRMSDKEVRLLMFKIGLQCRIAPYL